jgi:hypothetical protein
MKRGVYQHERDADGKQSRCETTTKNDHDAIRYEGERNETTKENETSENENAESGSSSW